MRVRGIKTSLLKECELYAKLIGGVVVLLIILKVFHLI